jgi:hypothetical protein
LVYPDREELGRAVQRLLDTGQQIDHANDHGATVSFPASARSSCATASSPTSTPGSV